MDLYNNNSVLYDVNGKTYTVSIKWDISLSVYNGMNLFYLSKDGMITGEGITHVYEYDINNNMYNTFELLDSIGWLDSNVNTNNSYFVDISSPNPTSIVYSFKGDLPSQFTINCTTRMECYWLEFNR